MVPRILALDIAGNPRAWISLEDAITYHCKNQIAWEYGDNTFVARGGTQNDGTQSIIATKAIVSVRAASGFSMDKLSRSVPMSNRLLFARDQYLCAYCGNEYISTNLSRDHIVPMSKGGPNTWMNCVTACKGCNCYKDNKLLSECDLELLYVPYIPNFAEKLILGNRNILSDQMEFLKAKLPKHSRILVN